MPTYKNSQEQRIYLWQQKSTTHLVAVIVIKDDGQGVKVEGKLKGDSLIHGGLWVCQLLF